MAMPITRMRVVCTLGDTIETFEPTSALTSVDLPALGAPTMAAKPARVRAARALLTALLSCLEHQGRRGALGLALGQPAPLRRRQVADRDLDQEHRLVLGAFAADLLVGRQRQPACPAPIPAAGSWAAAARDAGCPAARPTAARRLAAAASKPASTKIAPSSASSMSARMVRRGLGRAAIGRCDGRAARSPRRSRPACARSPARHGGGRAGPRARAGKRRSRRSAMASDSTRSPRNSRRSLPCGKAAFRSGRLSSVPRWVSASTASSARLKEWPSLSLSDARSTSPGSRGRPSVDGLEEAAEADRLLAISTAPASRRPTDRARRR